MLVLAALLSLASSSEHIRGISPDQANDYIPDKNGYFTCLGDPSIKIPFSKVNDNYCDCPDGSDEPGTSACEFGKFWCPGMNEFISSRYVDDGVCDYFICCDGSDEKPGLCENRCEEVHAELKKKQEVQNIAREEASHLHQQMVLDAENMKIDLSNTYETLLARKLHLAAEIRNKRLELKHAYTQDTSSNGDRESMMILKDIHSALMNAQTDFNELVNDFKALEDSYRMLDRALQQMSVDYNPNFNDPAVKEAINVWKNTPKVRSSPPPVNDLSYAMDSISRVKVAPRVETDSAHNQRSMDDEFEDLESDTEGQISFQRMDDEPDDSVAIKAIKDSINILIGKAAVIEKDIYKSSKLLNLGEEFFGPHEVGRTLGDSCFNIKKGDFFYNVCLFGTAVQKNGRYTVKLGTSKGLKMRDDLAVIKFENGDGCKNGVSRSLEVILTCGKTTELDSINELELCSYLARGTSPLACVPDEIIHDEL